ncbi:phage tail sheath protein FI [Flavobacterium sp. PL11]|uniref:phage tail sheath C-terminal domain-containing protein n=1 Tax=Flavobacterium sp. PL11 TaxID=3071717 RepID=UPI002DFA87B3|nr:phage tail sheath protein FI [Flavobacterium sp. PL11]
MPNKYKTPGVYNEEVVNFPPLIIKVETAIPAFIGYTEKAKENIDNDLINIPKRISSLLEFESNYGAAYPENSISVNIVDMLLYGSLQRVIHVNPPNNPNSFLMHYALQMYFANGGGPCYIIAVETYKDEHKNENTITLLSLNNGLNVLKTGDEPTLILFPDAKSLSKVDFYSLYSNALIQCHEMQDRFTIIDTRESKNSLEDTATLRSNINLEKNYLQYGAVYYPHLETILNYKYNEKDVMINHLSYTADVLIKSLNDFRAAKVRLLSIISSLITITDDTIMGSIAAVITYIESPFGFDNLDIGVFTLVKKADFSILVKALNKDLKNITAQKNLVKDACTSAIASLEKSTINNDRIRAATSSFITVFEDTNNIESIKKNIKNLSLQIKNAHSDAEIKNLVKTNAVNIIDEIQKLLNYTPILGLPKDTLTIARNIFAPIPALLETITTELELIDAIDESKGIINRKSLADIESIDNATYNIIKAQISDLSVIMPPSSSIAGVYAKIDSNSGVWKAPANVALNYVIKPTITITNIDQEVLNIDTIADKSINAIRHFAGKGILIWGARTLAGNDSEWRYISVRRFFNMIQESIKKSLKQFVFEPNDANTWIRVSVMIEDFLVLQWRSGALTGAKPEQAFYVKVGLGQSMSDLDVLKGRLIIEIGMAPLRPAEFIIIKFSQKMQEI